MEHLWNKLGILRVASISNGIEEFWQYGSDETIKIENQDGVAPQKAIDGLSEKSDKTKFGRVYIPKDGSVPVGWFLSHSLANYMWIFNQRKQNDSSSAELSVAVSVL